MATQKSGAISASDLRTEITRGGSGSLSMSDVRNIYGKGSQSISFNELYGAEAFIITPDVIFPSKVGYGVGWGLGEANSSISPSEVNGTMTFVTNSYCLSVYSFYNPEGDMLWTHMTFDHDANAVSSSNVNNIPIGWRPTDVTRMVISNTNTTFTANANPAILESQDVSIPRGANTPLNFLVKF